MSTEMNAMTTELSAAPLSTAVMEQVLLGGDLAKLTPEQRLSYYRSVCDSLGLNPLTKPFDYLTLNDKLVLYAKKDCTDQLRSNRQISIRITDRQSDGTLCIVTAQATDPTTGRTDESIGVVPLVKAEGAWKTAQSGKKYFEATGNTIPLMPDDRANAMMKAETKAKRRATLSICGLGLLDESEIADIDPAVVVEPERPLEQPKPKTATTTQTTSTAQADIDPQASTQARYELTAQMCAARDRQDLDALNAIGTYIVKNSHLFAEADLKAVKKTHMECMEKVKK